MIIFLNVFFGFLVISIFCRVISSVRSSSSFPSIGLPQISDHLAFAIHIYELTFV